MSKLDIIGITMLIIVSMVVVSCQTGAIQIEISKAQAQIAMLSKQVNDISNQLVEYNAGVQTER